MGTFPQVPPFKFLKIGIFNLLGFYIYQKDELKGGTWGNVPYLLGGGPYILVFLNQRRDLDLVLTVSAME